MTSTLTISHSLCTGIVLVAQAQIICNACAESLVCESIQLCGQKVVCLVACTDASHPTVLLIELTIAFTMVTNDVSQTALSVSKAINVP